MTAKILPRPEALVDVATVVPTQGAEVTRTPQMSATTRSLMRVTVTIPPGDEGGSGRRFDEDLATQAMITPNIDALNDALSMNPGRYGEWAMLEELARAQYDDLLGNLGSLDSDIKDLEAKVYLEVLEDPKTTGGKALTVDGIKATVQVDPRRLALVERRKDLDAATRDAKSAMNKLGVGKKTMEQKRDSLLALASNWRQEMQHRLTVSAQQHRPGPPVR
jgi:hypothetical protein